MPKDKPKILFLINSLCGGGAERIMTTLLRNSEAKRDEYDIHLALLDREPPAYAAPAWANVHQLDCRFQMLASLSQVRSLAKALDPDCIVSFLTRANVANCLVSAARQRPAIISERINTDMQLGSGVRGLVSKAIVRFAYRKATRVIAVSHGVGDSLARNYGVEQRRIDVIANPIDVEHIRARAAEEPSVNIPAPFTFAMGRLVPKKNFALLLRAFAISNIPGTLVIAGEGPEKEALLSLARELGVSKRLLLTGFLANPYALLARARTFVLSSDAEGFPNALVEAMSLGIPCVATNCADGPAEILFGRRREAMRGSCEGDGGILIPSREVAAMSEALTRVQDPRLRRKLAALGRARAELYGVQTSVNRYWAVIGEAMGRQSPRA